MYIFPHDIEMKLRQHLKLLVLDQHQSDKAEIVKEVTSDSSVQFYWSFLAVDLDEEVAQQLLVELAQQLLVFSFGSQFMVSWKQEHTQKTTNSVVIRLPRNLLDSEKV